MPPENHGARWSQDQDDWLLSALKKGKTLGPISIQMKRTEGGIRSHLLQVAANKVLKEGLTLAEAATLTHVSQEDIQEFMDKKHTKVTKLATFYAVQRGLRPGIYETWAECMAMTQQFKGSSYKKFKTHSEAEEFMASSPSEESQVQEESQDQEDQDPTPLNPNPTLSSLSTQSTQSTPTATQSNDQTQNYFSPLDPASLMPENSSHNNPSKALFITGPAGTGKSYTIQRIRRFAQDNGLDLACTATTGVAAQLLEGRTINSFLGVGLCTKTVEELVAHGRKIKQVADRLKSFDILIIGKTNPAQKLDVAGAIAVNGTTVIDASRNISANTSIIVGNATSETASRVEYNISAPTVTSLNVANTSYYAPNLRISASSYDGSAKWNFNGVPTHLGGNLILKGGDVNNLGNNGTGPTNCIGGDVIIAGVSHIVEAQLLCITTKQAQ